MKTIRCPYFLFALIFVFGISACCRNDDAPPIAAIEFAIYDSTGEDNLFDEDGPYAIDSLQIFQEDGVTLADYDVEPLYGGFYLFRDGSESEEITYYVHFPDGEVDTLIGTFTFTDSKCYSYWSFESFLYNNESFKFRDENGFIKVLKD